MFKTHPADTKVHVQLERQVQAQPPQDLLYERAYICIDACLDPDEMYRSAYTQLKMRG